MQKMFSRETMMLTIVGTAFRFKLKFFFGSFSVNIVRAYPFRKLFVK